MRNPALDRIILGSSSVRSNLDARLTQTTIFVKDLIKSVYVRVGYMKVEIVLLGFLVNREGAQDIVFTQTVRAIQGCLNVWASVNSWSVI